MINRIKSSKLYSLIKITFIFLPYFIFDILLWSFIHGIPLFLGLLISKLIDQASIDPASNTVWILLIIAVVIMILRAIFLVIGLSVDFTLSYKISSYLKEKVLFGILHDSFLQNINIGKVLNNISIDTDEVADFIRWSCHFLYRVILLVAAFTILMMTNMFLTLALVPIVFGLYMSKYIKNRIGNLQADKRKYQGFIAEQILDIFLGIRALRLGNKCEERIYKVSHIFLKRRETQIKHRVFVELVDRLFEYMVAIGTTIILLILAEQIVKGNFSIGELILFLTYIVWISEQISLLGNVITSYKDVKINLGNITHHLSTIKLIQKPKDFIKKESPSILKTLTIKNLVCTPNQKPISFTANKNDLIVITGDAGAGKSMFIRTLLTLNYTSKGSVLCNGIETINDSVHWKNPFVSYARHEAGFFKGTVRDNLSFNDELVTDDNIYKALLDVGLIPGSKELPQGLETDIGFGGNKLSGGQKQRLTFARMLCHPAQIYIVDNCDSALDAETSLNLWKTLPKKWPALWIVVSNNKNLFKQANLIIKIEREAGSVLNTDTI